MLRASVRYTFLTVEVAEECCQSSPSRRSRSAAARVQERDAFCHLDSLINSTSERPAKLSQQDWSLLSMKNVQSNSSVSTMAPEDWDAEDAVSARIAEQSIRAAETQVQSSSAGSTAAPEDWDDKTSTLSLSCEGDRPRGTVGFQHIFVPRSQNLAVGAKPVESVEALALPTTLMIRNVPNRYSQDELIDELERLGFAGSFDFFYAPIDVGTLFNVGYAFVNFVDGACAARCQEVLAGYVFEKHQKPSRQRVATVSVAHLQGLEANLRHYEQSAVSRKARSKRSGPVVMPVAMAGGLLRC